MLRSWWLLSAAVLVSCNGCMQAPVEHTVRKVTTEDVRRDTEKAVDTASRAAAQAICQAQALSRPTIVSPHRPAAGDKYASCRARANACPKPRYEATHLIDPGAGLPSAVAGGF